MVCAACNWTPKNFSAVVQQDKAKHCFIFTKHIWTTKFEAMTTLTIHPANSEQDTAIRVFLDSLHVDYKTGEEMDETNYLNSSPAMVEHLNKAMNEEQRGKGTNLTLDEIWK